MIVYKIQNKINGKIYIGQTTMTLQERIDRHQHNNVRQSILCQEIKRLGIEQFSYETIESCSERLQLDERERFWIAFYNSRIPYGYNMTEGGPGTPGHKVLDTTKYSEAKKRNWLDPEYRKKLSDKHWSNNPDSLEKVRKRLSEVTTKMHQDGVLGGYRGGGIKTEESRKKASNSFKKIWENPEYRLHMSLVHKGKKQTEESKRKRSESLKAFWEKRREELQCVA